MSIRTILFDLDGTLIDTNELIIASFEHTLKKYNYHFTRDEIKAFNGPPLWSTFESLDKEKAEEMVETYIEHNHKIHDKYARLYPNVLEVIAALQEKGINIGIVTAKMRDGVELGIQLTGLNKYFDTIVTVDDVKNPKPSAEPVLKAMHELNGDIKTTLMVGDSSQDIEAGQNAGVQTAGVAWSDKGKAFLE